MDTNWTIDRVVKATLTSTVVAAQWNDYFFADKNWPKKHVIPLINITS